MRFVNSYFYKNKFLFCIKFDIITKIIFLFVFYNNIVSFTDDDVNKKKFFSLFLMKILYSM